MMIPFNRPCCLGLEGTRLAEVMRSRKFSGDGAFTGKCSEFLRAKTGASKVLLTTSCSHALDLAALLLDIREGDEVIMPSYTFVSTANAFVLRGARIAFVDIRPDTMNIDERLIETAITSRTKAIVPVHYAGVSCEMDVILDIASRRGLSVIEDAAQGVHSSYKGKSLGTIGDMGAFSFHETKNYTCGEGGAILFRDERFVERAVILREKGTNRTKYFQGLVDKYTWVDIGSSFLPSELNAAFLFAQLESYDVINENRLSTWNRYYRLLSPLADRGKLELPVVPRDREHNAHMFYVKVADLQARTELIAYLKSVGVNAVFHYVPLHSAPAGKIFGRFHGEDRYTTRESERLVRLPLYYGIEESEVAEVVGRVEEFFEKARRE
jgi:dTDP-4-amino-4,6-dideoxygalactose transaminase